MTQLTVQSIQGKILSLPNRPPFMLTRDLAEIYETEPRQINQAVRRNPERFPEDFCFELTADEIGWLQNEATPHLVDQDRARAFTRMGANMLSAILKSKVAAQRCVQIMRAFSAMEDSAQKSAPDMDALLSKLFGHADSQHVVLTKDRYIELLEGALAAQSRKIEVMTQPIQPEFGKPRRWTRQEETTMFDLLRQGLGDTRIGYQLGRSPSSVRNHRNYMASKSRAVNAALAGGAA